MNEKLKPCPFCGSRVKKVISPVMNIAIFVCENCGADVCFYEAENGKCGERAVKAWNRRVEDEEAD